MQITDFLEIAAGMEWYCAISYDYNNEKLLQYVARDCTDHRVLELSRMGRDGAWEELLSDHWSKIMMEAARGYC